jgi:hypothetical protein
MSIDTEEQVIKMVLGKIPLDEKSFVALLQQVGDINQTVASIKLGDNVIVNTLYGNYSGVLEVSTRSLVCGGFFLSQLQGQYSLNIYFCTFFYSTSKFSQKLSSSLHTLTTNIHIYSYRTI